MQQWLALLEHIHRLVATSPGSRDGPWFIRYERHRRRKTRVLNHHPSPPVLVPGHEFTGDANFKWPSPGASLLLPEAFLPAPQAELTVNIFTIPVRCLRHIHYYLLIVLMFPSLPARTHSVLVARIVRGASEENCQGSTELTRAWVVSLMSSSRLRCILLSLCQPLTAAAVQDPMLLHVKGHSPVAVVQSRPVAATRQVTRISQLSSVLDIVRFSPKTSETGAARLHDGSP